MERFSYFLNMRQSQVKYSVLKMEEIATLQRNLLACFDFKRQISIKTKNIVFIFISAGISIDERRYNGSSIPCYEAALGVAH